jgi:tryptophanyl-tRNA synthetase
MKQTILTGIRVNSDLHIGHLFGVILPMTHLANTHSKNSHINIFIPDLHSVVSEIDGDFQKNLITSIKTYLAAGLKLTENVHVYRQSYVPAHSELAWLLDCTATMGEMNRMTQWKEKSAGKGDSTNVGVFNYPVLMAADILLYSATYVPVGEDQFQHIELTRNLAERFNNKYGEIFALPAKTADQAKFMGLETGLRIRSLTNPEKKMSKSDPSEASKIMLTDDPKTAKKKIMSATTDSIAEIKFDMFNQPGVSNLLQIESCVSDQPLQQVILEWAGRTNYGELKSKVAASVAAYLTTFQQNLAAISDQTVSVLFPLGESYANKIANAKLLEAQKALRLR